MIMIVYRLAFFDNKGKNSVKKTYRGAMRPRSRRFFPPPLPILGGSSAL